MQDPRIADTAVKWGVDPQDTLHAYRNAITFTVGGDDMNIAVGPARSGAFPEVGFIHAIDGRGDPALHAGPTQVPTRKVIPMPRTVEEILAHAEELTARFESEDFEGIQLTPDEYTLYAAARDRAAAEARLAQAVMAARKAGTSWAKIGKVVGTSGEAARQRYTALT